MSVCLLSVLLLTNPWPWSILFPVPAGSFCSSFMGHTSASTLFSTPKPRCGQCHATNHSFLRRPEHPRLIEIDASSATAYLRVQSSHLTSLGFDLSSLSITWASGDCSSEAHVIEQFSCRQPQKHWLADSRYWLSLNARQSDLAFTS